MRHPGGPSRRLIQLVALTTSALLLGAGLALLAWSTAVVEGSELWQRTMATGTALEIAAAIVGMIGTIAVRSGRKRR
ncbi:hypothetical protein [Curtobacterium sp. 9128]|uniref:hypothetical protein n=1 Tax=Curtobacterium sp. 9128 TaxID=1793722 RepID=UPI00119D0469|nr:hypothetical protein [Curtobacterium sp. 9128]